MLSDYSLETSFGEIALGDLTKDHWDDIKSLAEALIKDGDIKEFHQASIAAFIIWVSEIEFMNEGLAPGDKMH